jgi:hypothetical protein
MIWFNKISDFSATAKTIDTFIQDIENRLAAVPSVQGYCDCCGMVKALLNTVDSVDWLDNRSQFRCETCHLQARLRMFWKCAEEVIETTESYSKVLLLEAVTAFSHRFCEKYPFALVSEYVEAIPSGSQQELSGVKFQCEDLLNLSFRDGTLDIILHQDVLEHVPDADQALKEIHRVLRVGGKTLFTAPFYHYCDQSLKRAIIVDGKINYLAQPVYHGNPLSPKGSLVFEMFGLDFFRRCVDTGFSKCQIGLDYDIGRGFLSNGNPYQVGKMLPVVFLLAK